MFDEALGGRRSTENDSVADVKNNNRDELQKQMVSLFMVKTEHEQKNVSLRGAGGNLAVSSPLA